MVFTSIISEEPIKKVPTYVFYECFKNVSIIAEKNVGSV